MIQKERPRSIEDFVNEQVIVGKWHEEAVPAEVAGTPRDLVIFRAPRKATRIGQWH